MTIQEQIAKLRGWNTYISHCAEHDLEMTGSDYDKTADYLNGAADTMEKLLAVYEAAIEYGDVRTSEDNVSSAQAYVRLRGAMDAVE